MGKDLCVGLQDHKQHRERHRSCMRLPLSLDGNTVEELEGEAADRHARGDDRELRQTGS